MPLTPIETRYGGYHFRSRLEARWAVFFNKFRKARWTYEEEGLALPSGWYLPDFWLKARNGRDCIIEIKPTRDFGDMTLPELQFGREILAASPGLGYLIFFGDPMGALAKGWDQLADTIWAPEPTGDDPEFNLPAMMLLLSLRDNWPAAQAAMLAAREARFEHGAKP